LGEVPFIRTSDIADWELAGLPKQRISSELYDALRARVDVQPGDVLFVRDGTYLIGTSAILSESDSKALYSGHLYKLRVKRPEEMDPYLLLALLNMPIVKQQIRSRQFTSDIIDTLGARFYELVIPIPKSKTTREFIADVARSGVDERARLRDRAKAIVIEMEGAVAEIPEEREAADNLAL
jgi:type I restriction enzyme M protein